MYKICPPPMLAAQVYRETAESISNEKRRQEHLQCTGEIVAKCKEYDHLGKAAKFETALPSSFHVSNLDVSAMPELYDKQFVRLKKTKVHRDLIKSGAQNNSCPYCGIGFISQLDHYLPKSEFHAITVHPHNLVPSCADCNSAKRAYHPSEDSPAVFHPYFDDVFDFAWLDATLLQGHDRHTIAKFGVDEKIEDVQLRDRMLKHLEVFKLQSRFSSAASQLIQEFERFIRDRTHEFNLESAKSHLKFSIKTSSALRLNDYRAATYRAMLTSPWYLNSLLVSD